MNGSFFRAHPFPFDKILHREICPLTHFFLHSIRTCGVCHREMTGLKGNPVKVRNSTRCCNPAPVARLVKRFANKATVPVLGWEGW